MVFSFSCKKEVNKSFLVSPAFQVLDELATTPGDCERRWFGLYANGLQPNDSIIETKFIKDGSAKLPPVNWYNYHTGIYYDIPLCHSLHGDTVRFEASVKNPTGQSGSVFDYEVALQVYGSKNYGEVYFTGSASTQSYNHIWIGNYQISNLPELNHYFGDYETLSVEFKNDKLSIYRNGIFVKNVTYDASNKIGKIKRIGYGFKGTGSIDWVKLYSSKNDKLLMQEDFNVDGQANVIWY